MTESESHLIHESESTLITVKVIDDARVQLKAYFKQPTNFSVNLTLTPKAAAELGRWLANNDYV